MPDETAMATGAKWFRGALQVNPFGYQGHPAPSDAFPTEDAYNAALLDKCAEQGIDFLAVTDHWKASTAAGLIEAAASRGVVVLPGFEANCKEGFHLLIIFEAGTELDTIAAAIGWCGAPEDDPHGPGSKSFSEVAGEMTRRGALVIPAHVNVATSGLLSRESGKPLQNIVKDENILALGITPSQEAMADQESILANRKPYERQHPLVAIHADDVSHPNALATEGASTWFKMSAPSLRGLHHALRTPQTRVRRTLPTPLRGTRLRSISWTGGFLDGMTVPIGPELTALIGGRGTGKSTVIESVRFALEQAPIGKDALRDHDGVVTKVLGPGAIVRLEIEQLEPTPARYVVQRTVGDPALVLDSSGTRTQQRPSDVIGELEAFGQHELAELAHDKTLLADLIRRLGGDFSSEGKRPGLVAKLKKNRTDLAGVERLQEALEIDLAEIPRLTEQSQKFDATDLGQKLEVHKLINDERAIFDETDRRVEATRARVEAFDATAAITELTTPLPDSTDSARRVDLIAAVASIRSVADVVQASVTAIDNALEAARRELQESRKRWTEKVEPDLEAHASTMRSLAEQGYEPDTYLKTAAALKALTLRTDERAALDVRQKALISDRAGLLGELAILDGQIASDLHQAISAANDVTKKKVNVRPTPNPDRTSLKAVVDRFFKTPRTQIMSAIDSENFSVASFVKAARSQPHELGKYGISGAQATNLLSHGEALFREIEEHTVGLAVDVHLNVAPDGVEYRKLDDLSKGQRATALLLLLLSVSTSPLIIDQPEDDLDNRFVYHGIVQHLRELKGVRQVLVSTHNANVPVLGDAELVVVLESDGHHGSNPVGGVGSLDEPAIRQFAERLLEGGEEAFRARRHLYGF
ncbi:TrlF family AAA-like ATPase [Frigoribacterium sp. VKM Ac-2530]|uniref:TrlF family AAA-like ATPase n=1 Tax=Frigoribacterium sp. VKM Ac-2530 TaxID=2783822 RepID=UPI001889D8A3|nr:hypothetical protein [Frigoribacterium sp. VKM Ac-2530]MBF4580379.1 hypothetical protein [Frigoribacterium sp. VKM Ac-2530]